MSNRTFILVCLILLSGIATNWIIEDAESDAVDSIIARNDPDIYMVKPRITQFNERGVPQHKIHAERMTHFPLTDVTTLADPNLILYQESVNNPWDIIAKNGRLLPRAQLREEIVELWDQVVAAKRRSESDFINIRTESLTVYPEQNFVETEVSVAIDNEQGTTTAGGGMKGDLNAGLFTFSASREERVNTLLKPARPSTR